ncbi:fasciclin domain-containing protein [Xanthovirga aplysinae]|uniref:fasciclin domain-containing protein n=1 Tax=Xanthovirga aplysinae TaxID=2529853 RepID=UPI0012BB88CC|nr:fasciclin domain-containing protein [Xanthovirga aplysinae]MTI29599.1 fasciclin domain-containing protein [Xanthovirga aplysinae]
MKSLRNYLLAIAVFGFLGSAATAQEKDIVELAQGNENLSTLVAALQAAGLVEELESKGQFTVFAPTNDAFAALPPGTLEYLLKPENKDELIEILTYHVCRGELISEDLKKKQEVKTLEGDKITVKKRKGEVTVNEDAMVVMADIQASNGVVHVIDKVILPPED